MPVIRWRANAGRRYPQYTLPAESVEIYGNQSTPPGSYAGSGTLVLHGTTTGTAILGHFATGTETDYLYLAPTITATVNIGARLASGALSLLPTLAGTSYIGRVGTGAMQLLPSITALAWTETGGNKSATGALSLPASLSGTAIIQHSTTVLFTVAPFLTAEVLISRQASGTLQLVPTMQGNSINTQTGIMRLEPTLSGEAVIRVQSGIWVVIPESGGGWTTQ